jgi:predicted nucleotidyltransferase
VDVTPYLQNLSERERHETDRRRARAAVVRARLPELTSRLASEFGVTRIVLFGSLLDGELREDSDVDIAVVGLDPSNYFRAVDVASSSVGVDVDLVPLEEAPLSLRELINRHGEVLL